MYSRYTQEVSSRAEHVLSKVLVCCNLISSGHALILYMEEWLCADLRVRLECCLRCKSSFGTITIECHQTPPKAMIHYQPKRIAIREGYHGSHNSIEIYKRSRPEVEVIDIDADFQPGDLCWIETPVNPYGESR
jgi:hypothetical protein